MNAKTHDVKKANATGARVSTTRVASGNVNLHVVMYGDSKKTPIVLVHGYPDIKLRVEAGRRVAGEEIFRDCL